MTADLVLLLVRGLGNATPITTKNPLSMRHAAILRIMATCLASVSVLAGLLAVFWFLRMKRKFRHSLIMTLILADLFRSLNYISFTAVYLSRGAITTAMPYCQASGFMIQFATEVTDLTVLFIAIHMALQIFTPTILAESESGLHRFRHSVFAAILGLPLLSACLAFLNNAGGYAIQGPFCILPIRPFWYRLALAWVPRYIIATTVLILTVLIHWRVRKYTKAIEEECRSSAPGSLNIVEGDFGSHHSTINDEKVVTEIELGPASPSSSRRTSQRIQVVSKSFMLQDLPQFSTTHYPQDQYSPDRLAIKTSHFSQDTVSTGLPFINTSHFSQDTCATGLTFPASPSPPDLYSPALRTPSYISTTDADACYFAQGARRNSSMPDYTRRNSSMPDYPPVSYSKRPSIVSFSPSVSAQLLVPKRGDRKGSVVSVTRMSSLNDIVPRQHQQQQPGESTATTPEDLDESAPVLASPEPRRPASPKRSFSTTIINRARRSIHSRTASAQEDDSAAAVLRRRHRYIQRQMQLLLLYPVIYLLMWLFPFVLHCLLYSDYYVTHAPFGVVVMAYICYTLFGAVNSLSFCLRERPWTQIPDSDGTILGSFTSFPSAVGKARAMSVVSWNCTGLPR